MTTRTVWLIEFNITQKTGYFKGIKQDLTPAYATSPFDAMEFDTHEEACFAKFYFSLSNTSVNKHIIG